MTTTYSSQIKGFGFEHTKTKIRDGWNASELHIYSHAGTHMDAPFHFEVTDERIDEISVERFVSKAHVVNVEVQRSQQLITVSDFSSIDSVLLFGESVIVKTGWSKYLGTDRFRSELPRISKEAAEWLVQKRVNMLVVEPPSVADVNNLHEVTLIHQILLGGNVIIVEGISNTEELVNATVQLIALPLKVFRGDGAPARVIAIQE